MASTLPLPSRLDLSRVFTDPSTLLMVEQLLQQLASVIPGDLSALGNLGFVLTAADTSVAPNGHVIEAGSGITITVASGSVTISASAAPFGFGFDKDLAAAVPSQPFIEFATEIAFTLASGLSNSVVKLTAAGTAPGADTVFDLQIGGVSVGSITFAAGSHVATLAMAADHTVTPATTVQIVAPASLNGMTGRLFGSIVGVRG